MMDEVFLPQTVPAYAATETINHAAQEIHRIQLQGGHAQPHQPAQPHGRLGGRHGQPLPQPRRTCKEIVGRARSRPPGRSLFIAQPDPDQQPGLPRSATASPSAAPPTHDQDLRRGQRLRLEAQRNRRRAGGHGAHGRCRCERPSAPSPPSWRSLAAVFVAVFIVLNIMLSLADRAPHPQDVASRPTRSAPATSASPSSTKRAATKSPCWAARSTACAAASRRPCR